MEEPRDDKRLVKYGRPLWRLWGVAAACVLVGVLALPWLASSQAPSASQYSSVTAIEQLDGGLSSDAGSVQADGQAGALVVSHGEDGIAAEHEAGVVLAKVPANMTLDDFNGRIAQLDFLAPQAVSEADLSLGWAELAVAGGVALSDAMQMLESSGAVAAAQPNYVYRLVEADESDDTALQPGSINGDFPPEAEPTGESYDTREYFYFVDDSQANNQTAIFTVQLKEAYDYLYGKGYVSEAGISKNKGPLTWAYWSEGRSNSPTIAVLDTGCYINHVDLRNNIVDYYDAVRGTKEDFTDIDGHGTHVCGIASAEMNNRLGIVGVSFNARLMPVNVFKYGSSGCVADSKDIAAAYEYVLENAAAYNVRVVNLSLGSETEEADQDDKLFLEAIEQAYRKGILTVIAAGNSGAYGAYTDFPADFASNAVSVIDCAITSVTSDQNSLWGLTIGQSRVGYSNYNKAGTVTKQVCALGDYVLSTVRSGYYGTKSGTSMASPCVAGLAALAWQVKPNLTVEQVKSLLYSTADDVTEKVAGYEDEVAPGFDVYTGFGTVNAFRLVKAADAGLYLSVEAGEGRTDIPVLGKGVASASSVKFAAPAREGAAWIWESSSPAVASVDETGLVTAAGCGQAIISASSGTGDDAVVLYTTVTVRDAEITGTASVACGSTTTLQVSEATPANDALLTGGTWQWSSSDGAIAPVGEWSGVVTGKATGSATITATLVSNPAVQLSKAVTVSAQSTTPTKPDPDSSESAGSSESAPKPDPVEPEKPAPEPEPANPGPTNPDSGKSGESPGPAPSPEPNPEPAPTPEPGQEPARTQVMHRLYNPWSGEHFYTSDESEYESVVAAGWTDEGPGWNAPDEGDPVFRLYNPYAGEHHYTLDPDERDDLVAVGWVDEGTGWHSDTARTVPLFREYNPFEPANNHNYTADRAEHDALVALGWLDEGEAWYGCA